MTNLQTKDVLFSTIPGLNDSYKASYKGGIILSIKRTIKNGKGSSATTHLPERIMKQRLNNMNYRILNLSINGVKTRALVHRLVALAHVPNPLNLPHVNHKDGNPLNNDAPNLEWVTPKQNAEHASRMGLLIRENRGEKAKNAKLTNAQAEDIRKKHTFCSQSDLARIYGVSKAVIRNVIFYKSYL